MNNANTAAAQPELLTQEGPQPLTIVPRVPENGRALTNANTGKVTGHEYYLGTQTAKELKEKFKLAGFKGNDLKAKVNAALGDEASQRKIAAFAAIEFAHKEKGLLPDVCQLRKSSGTIKLVSGGAMTDSAATKEAAELKKQNGLLLIERTANAEKLAKLEAQIAELSAKKK